MKDCTFCQVYEARDRIVYENDWWFARFDLFPVSPGHVHVIPKRHVASYLDLSMGEAAMLKPMVARTLEIVNGRDLEKFYEDAVANPLNNASVHFCKKALASPNLDKKIEDFNLGINDGVAAGRTIDHLHVHLIPRFEGDIENALGGVRRILPGMRDYRNPEI
ncbi:HIT family protein [Methanococcoides sp. SA1]|nr:HIT family protein [Methanococcoides sp. SA1]